MKSTRTPYTTVSGRRQYKPAYSALVSAEADLEGFCLACGEFQPGCEPDLKQGKCEACGKLKVYGAERLLIMGLYDEGK